MSAQGIVKLINIVRTAPIEPAMPVPDILIIAPPLMDEPKGTLVNKFIGSQPRSLGLSEELQKVAETQVTYFFDAASVTPSSKVDGIHLDADQHQVLGQAIAKAVLQLNILYPSTNP
jgi:lysophospholipase L1-like esterase